MEREELECCQRFKELRKALNIKQGDFAKELAISQGHASDIENGRKAVSNRIIEILSLKYSVNEGWLRTGNGDMFVPMTRSETIAKFAGELLKEEEESFKRRLLSALAKLDERQWEVLESIVNEIVKRD